MKKHNIHHHTVEPDTLLISGPEACRILGITRKRFLLLRRGGHIIAAVPSSRDPLYRREDVMLLPARMCDHGNSAY